jgi:hypothetical protein
MGSARSLTPRGRLLLVASALAAIVALAVAVVTRLTDDGPAPVLVPRDRPIAPDPLAYDPARDAELERAAADGLAHPVYTRSPRGVLASAARTARFRPLVEAATAGTSVDADMLEALVLLESAGRPDVIAGDDPVHASGLTQIVAETAVNFLGMDVDLEASRFLTRRIAAARRAGNERRARRLEAERRRVDPRFDPAQALAGAVRYLSTARARLGRDDLAFVSYHMGIGNLEGVLRAYAGVEGSGPTADLARARELSYARVFFDSSPRRHAAAWGRLAALGDRSRDYYWRLLAAREVMRLYRGDRDRLARLARLHASKPSAEDVLRPPDETERFADPDDLAEAWDAGEIHPLPHDPARLGLARARGVGGMAADVDSEPELYRGLRADALAVLVYVADQVQRISRTRSALVVTDAVRDERYHQLLVAENLDTTRGYSLHTTGYAFDIRRDYGSGAQAAAFQFVLERLEALSLIAWVRESRVIHVTVGPRAEPLVPVLLRRRERE